jgi:hypothetical protein
MISMMKLSKLLNELRAEQDRIATAIKVLTPYVETPETARRMLTRLKAPQVHTVHDHPPKVRKRHLSAAQKARLSRRMKAVWVAKRKAAQ